MLLAVGVSKEYVLINPETMSVECFRRNSDRLWVLYPYAEGEEVHLNSVNFCCSIASLYEDVLLKDDSVSNGDRLP